MANLFERLNKRRPTKAAVPPTEAGGLLEILDKERPLPIEEASKPPTLSPTEKLQDWIDRRWRKTIICARDIYIHGPYGIRDKKTALKLARILVQQGGLVPIRAHRRDRWTWKVVPKRQRPTTPASQSAATP